MSLWVHFIDPRRVFHRYFLHWLVCAFIPGAYFHDSLIAALKNDIMEHMSIDNTSFGFLFSIASITAVIVGPAGLFLSKVGTCTSALVCGFVCFSGSFLSYLGIYLQSYLILLLGRFIFWLFLWLLQVVQNVLTYQNFQGKQLAVAYGLLVTACRVGGTLGYSLSGPLRRYCEGSVTPLADQIFISVMAVLASFFATLGFALLSNTRVAVAVQSNLPAAEQTYSEVGLSHWRKFPEAYWCLFLGIGCLYSAVFPFEAFGVPIIFNIYQCSMSHAGLLISIVPSISFGAPLLGMLFKGKGGGVFDLKMIVLAIGFSLIVCAFVGLSLHLSYPSIWVTLLGSGYAICATICWILIPDLLPTEYERLGVVYLYVSLGLSMFFSNIIAGKLMDVFNDSVVLAWFALLALVGLSCSYRMKKTRIKSTDEEPLTDVADSDRLSAISGESVEIFTMVSESDETIEVVDNHFSISRLVRKKGQSIKPDLMLTHNRSTEPRESEKARFQEDYFVTRDRTSTRRIPLQSIDVRGHDHAGGIKIGSSPASSGRLDKATGGSDEGGVLDVEKHKEKRKEKHKASETQGSSDQFNEEDTAKAKKSRNLNRIDPAPHHSSSSSSVPKEKSSSSATQFQGKLTIEGIGRKSDEDRIRSSAQGLSVFDRDNPNGRSWNTELSDLGDKRKRDALRFPLAARSGSGSRYKSSSYESLEDSYESTEMSDIVLKGVDSLDSKKSDMKLQPTKKSISSDCLQPERSLNSSTEAEMQLRQQRSLDLNAEVDRQLQQQDDYTKIEAPIIQEKKEKKEKEEDEGKEATLDS